MVLVLQLVSPVLDRPSQPAATTFRQNITHYHRAINQRLVDGGWPSDVGWPAPSYRRPGTQC